MVETALVIIFSGKHGIAEEHKTFPYFRQEKLAAGNRLSLILPCITYTLLTQLQTRELNYPDRLRLILP